MKPTFDTDGYPTAETLAAIRNWDVNDSAGLWEFLRVAWRYPERFTEVDGTHFLSTGGWSGNEDLLDALQENQLFWLMFWQASRRGGHYEFRR